MRRYRDIIIIVTAISAICITSITRPKLTGNSEYSLLVGVEVTPEISEVINLSVTEDTIDIVPEATPLTSVEEESEELNLFSTFLDKKNVDYIGAISIPSVNLNDALYRDPADDFYLTNDYEGNKSKSGELYLDRRSAENLLSTGALINGHAMSDKTKFGSIKELLKIENQPELFIWDEYSQTEYKYKINAVSLIDNENSGFAFEFDSPEQRSIYYKQLYNSSIKKWEMPESDQPVLILNTCSYIIDQGRYLVIATLEGEVDIGFRPNY